MKLIFRGKQSPTGILSVLENCYLKGRSTVFHVEHMFKFALLTSPFH